MFAKNIFTVTVTQSANGKIDYYTDAFEFGQNGTFIIRANSGYTIKCIIVDGQEIEINKTETQYTFENISQDHTITAEFEVDDTVNNANNGSDILIWICVALVGLAIIILCGYIYRKKIHNRY